MRRIPLAFVEKIRYIYIVMDNSRNQVFTKQHLQAALDKAGLPSVYSTILKYERAHVIPRSGSVISYGRKLYRTYTQEEIDEIVKRIRAHKRVVR